MTDRQRIVDAVESLKSDISLLEWTIDLGKGNRTFLKVFDLNGIDSNEYQWVNRVYNIKLFQIL